MNRTRGAVRCGSGPNRILDWNAASLTHRRRVMVSKASERGPTHCNSAKTVGGGGLMVLRWRREWYRAGIQNLLPSERDLVSVIT